jgi:hypothetical protein
MSYLRPQAEYDVKARRISGSHAEKLEQIDVAIQELLDIKALECASDNPHVRFLAVPRPRSHAFAMTATILVLLILLVLLIGVRTSHAQDEAPQPAADAAATPPVTPDGAAPDKGAPEKARPFAFADFGWLSGNARTKDSPLDTKVFTGEFRVDSNFTYSFNKPIDDTISGSTEVFRSGEFQVLSEAYGALLVEK